MSVPYLVSARKYRPQTFDTVIGQEHITTTLKNAIRQNKLAHAYLFCGPRGVGKTTCARILARTINCENPTPDMEACGVCATCQSFNNNTSFNVFELDAASNNSVDDIRELVAGVRFTPQQGKYKIYIIDEVHMLSAAAFNAFLKTLEEPPPYAIFILATTEKHKILPTILSRCQIFDFKRIRTEATVQHLQAICAQDGRVADEDALHIIAQKSEGCMRDALSMLDRIAAFSGGIITYAGAMEHLAILDAEFYFALTDAMLAADMADALNRLDKALERGFEGNVIIDGLEAHFRNLLLCKDPRMANLLDLPAVQRDRFYQKSLQAPPSFLLSALNILSEAELHYKEATNKRLHTELCLIRLCYLQQSIAPAALQPLQAAQPAMEPVKKNPEPAIASLPNPAPPVAVQIIAPQEAAKPLPAAQEPQPAIPIEPKEEKQKPAVNTTAGSAPAPASGGPRVRKNFLADLDATLSTAEACNEQKLITADEVRAVFDQYKQQLKEHARSIVFAQFEQMLLNFTPPDELRITSPTDIVHTCALQQRNDLQDFFKAQTGCQLRIIPVLVEDENTAGNQERSFTKQELLEELMRINPNLQALKEGMGLQLDF